MTSAKAFNSVPVVGIADCGDTVATFSFFVNCRGDVPTFLLSRINRVRSRLNGRGPNFRQGDLR